MNAIPSRLSLPERHKMIKEVVNIGLVGTCLCLLIVGISVGCAFGGAPSNDLLTLIEQNDIAGVRRTLDSGADVNMVDTPSTGIYRRSGREFTPLAFAITFRNVEIAQLLLERGANPNQLVGGNYTALQFLTKWDWQLDSKDKGERRQRIFDLLMDHRADPNRADAYGNTPLTYAARYGPPAMVERLLAQGAQPNPPAGLTANAPLLEAAGIEPSDKTRAEQLVIVTLLLDAGADIGARKNSPLRTTVLYVAVHVNDLDLAKLLIARGADVNADVYTNEHAGWPENWTPLMEAAKHGYREMTALLLNNGADVTPKNSLGTTALDETTDPAIAALLKSKGSK